MSCSCTDGTPERSSPWPMLSIQEALSSVITYAAKCAKGEQTISLQHALGRRIVNDVVSQESFPPFPASIMDGYAINSDDGDGIFPIQQSINAGEQAQPLQKGHVAYITTGAPVPPGADAVIQIEHTEAVPDKRTHVKLLRRVAAGTAIRPVGCDIAKGDLVIPGGTIITSAEIALLASQGHTEFSVYTQPRVTVISTGDELVSASTSQLHGSNIRDSNRPMLLSAVTVAGGITQDGGIVKDQVSHLTNAITTAVNNSDIVILSGGVSMGNRDYIKPILQGMAGCTIRFGRLNLKPGKPTTFATVEQNGKMKLIFGLPGNPVSSLVCFQLLVVPAIRVFSGHTMSQHDMICHTFPRMRVRLVADIKGDVERPEYHRVHLLYDPSQHDWVALTTGSQLSSRLMSTRDANGLLEVPAGYATHHAGTYVMCLIVGELTHDIWQLHPQEGHVQGITHQHIHGHTHHPIHGHAHQVHAKHTHKHEHADHPTPTSTSTTTSSSTSTSTSAPTPTPSSFPIRVAIATISDRCSRGEMNDVTGPTARTCVEKVGAFGKNATASVSHQIIIPDDRQQIISHLTTWCDAPNAPHLILTCGGTGFSPRDVTPESVRSILDREASGLVFHMLNTSCQVTPLGALARPVAGTRKRTVIVTLPGSAKAILEILPSLLSILPHAIKLQQHQDDPHT